MSSLRLVFSLAFTLGVVTLASTEANAGPRFYRAESDSVGTLRICFKVPSVRENGRGFEAKLVYTGGEKLDRVSRYPTIRDVELKEFAVMDPANEIVYAYQNGAYACEIVWDYGYYWVVSTEEVSGDR